MASPNDELSSLLTPAILHKVLKNRLPWPMDKPLDWKEVHTYIFQAEDGPEQEQLREICWPTLQAISKLGVDNVPDMIQFLPSPESKDFLVQALGLQLLLDQAPRALCAGMDARYIMDYFQIVSRKYAQQLLDLPSDWRIDSKKRWVDEQGASLDFWILTRLWLIAPLVHNESLADHEFAEIMTEEVRVEVENVTGKTDPYRAKREELMQDTLAFPRMYNEGPSSENGLPMEGFAFWVSRRGNILSSIQQYCKSCSPPRSPERSLLLEYSSWSNY